LCTLSANSTKGMILEISVVKSKKDFYQINFKQKKMKKISSLLIAGLMIMTFGCKKDISKNDPVNPENPTTWQQNISPDFDWNMWKDVNVLLTNTQNKIITITTIDGEGQYAKMMGINDSYQLTIKMPKITEQISINGNIVNIQNGAVVYALPADYKSVATAQWALDFNATSNDYIAAGNPGIAAYPFSMEAWFKTAGYVNDMAIMGLCSSTDDEFQFGVYISQSDGKLNIRAKKDILNEELKGTKVVTDDIWHHVAVVFETANKRTLYVDGVSEVTHNTTSPLLLTEVNSFSIGRWGDSNPDSYFDGIIDEVRLWKTARSASNISTFRTKSIPSPYTGMSGYWPMEEGSGGTTANLKGGTAALTAPDWVGNIDTDEDGVFNINDDYPHDPARAFNNYWPANGGTLAFEDLWPSMGDYDMNDAVIGYSFNRVTNATNQLVEGIGTMTLKATGASLNAGFGFSLPDNVVEANHLNISGYQLNAGYITLNLNHSEAGQDTLTVIVNDLLPKPGNTYMGKFSRTYTYTVTLSITGGTYNMDDFGFQTWNPFIMVDHKIPNRRGHEIHLPGYARTNKVDVLLFDSVDDGSEYPTAGGGNLWYKTNVKAMAAADSVGQYFPWGLDIPGDFSWTIESDSVHQPINGYYRHTIWWGYRKFKQWAGSNGTEALDWYSVNNSTYRDEEFIWAP